MTPTLILNECRRRAITVWVDAGKLQFRGRATEMEGGLMECIRRYRGELVALLLSQDPTPNLVHPTPNLVHPTPNLVHPTPESSPPLAGGGLGALPDENPWLTSGSGSREEESVQSSPLSPPYCRDIDTCAEKNPTHKTGALNPSQGCARGNLVYTPPLVLTESGLSGLSGLTTASRVLDLSTRWGPALTDDEPSIVIPRDWRNRVAALPHADWTRWRHRANALVLALGRPANVDEIREADRQAAAEMGIVGAEHAREVS